jgi:hypothetical protein
MLSRPRSLFTAPLLACGFAILFPSARADELVRLKYNHSGLIVDLGVGLWAWPVPGDHDGDGDPDLIVVCPDAPYNGTYFFENSGGDTKYPVFKPARRLSGGSQNVTPSYVDGKPRVMTPAQEYPDFIRTGLDKPVKWPIAANVHPNKVRFNQWRLVDYDGDGRLDLTIGIEDWTDYGWDRAFNEKGEWTRGPLHGHIYFLRHTGGEGKGQYAEPVLIEAGGKPVDTFGCPSQNFVDFDGDDDLDLLCGEFLDGFTYFQNIGTRTVPKYAPGRRLMTADGKPLTMDLEMIVVVAFDWDRDGDADLIVAQEDGRVALVEHSGRVVDELPQFLPPQFFQQEADDLKFGALSTPVGVDWDGDGDDDLVSGNTAGYIGLLENLGGNPPKWNAPRYLSVDGEPIRIQAGSNGSIQGPAEAKWGYTTINVADWDHDGDLDVVGNSILGKVVWWQNLGTKTEPELSAARRVEVEWTGTPPKPAWTWWNPKPKELATQWRTTPVVFDWTSDGLNDLAMLDHEGYFSLFERRKVDGLLTLMPGRRIFRGQNGCEFDSSGKKLNDDSGPLRLNVGEAGKSGRRKLSAADWDGDGKMDLLVNGRNANWLRCVSRSSEAITFTDEGPLDTRVLAGHDTSPTTVDWDGDGIRDLVVGAEDGCFYFKRNPRSVAK